MSESPINYVEGEGKIVCPQFNQLDEVPIRFVIATEDADDPHVACPVCGCEWVHLVSVAVHQSEHSAHSTNDKTFICPTSRRDKERQRGSAVELAMKCEWGHVFVYGLNFHKGMTYARLAASPPQDTCDTQHELWRD